MNQHKRQVSQPHTALSHLTEGAITQATPPTLQMEDEEDNPAVVLEELE
jgi:hypothetical protein